MPTIDEELDLVLEFELDCRYGFLKCRDGVGDDLWQVCEVYEDLDAHTGSLAPSAPTKELLIDELRAMLHDLERDDAPECDEEVFILWE